jgi:hypothetical protein
MALSAMSMYPNTSPLPHRSRARFSMEMISFVVFSVSALSDIEHDAMHQTMHRMAKTGRAP